MSNRIEELSTASAVVQTARGPVETLITGDGPAVVILHGALSPFNVYTFEGVTCSALAARLNYGPAVQLAARSLSILLSATPTAAGVW